MRRVYEFFLILLVGIFVYLSIEGAANKMIVHDSYESEMAGAGRVIAECMRQYTKISLATFPDR